MVGVLKGPGGEKGGAGLGRTGYMGGCLAGMFCGPRYRQLEVWIYLNDAMKTVQIRKPDRGPICQNRLLPVFTGGR